ncbi:MAG TPA: universal stress protein [Gemmata sp.]|jgi:universal stress protein A|nr:universal stress protein [Gemmata sp.]
MVAIRRILAPADFDVCSSPTIRYAAELAEKFGAELILLHIVQDLALAMPDAVMPTPVPAPALTQLIDAAKTGLENLVQAENLGRLNPRLEVRVGSPAGEIVAVANDLKVDLVCIGTHGRGGLAHFLLGSVAEKVVRQAPCPVLTIRPPTK